MHIDSRPPIPEQPTISDVYEWFGAASYAAQVLEQSILNTLVVLDSNGRSVSETDWADFYQRYDRKTLGQMLSKLKLKHDLPDGFELLLDSALDERNRLCHHFFADNSEAFLFPAGRKRMIEDLSTMMSLYWKADGITEKVFDFHRRALGITEERIEELMQMALGEHLKKHVNG